MGKHAVNEITRHLPQIVSIISIGAGLALSGCGSFEAQGPHTPSGAFIAPVDPRAPETLTTQPTATPIVNTATPPPTQVSNPPVHNVETPAPRIKQARLRVLTYNLHALPCLRSSALTSVMKVAGYSRCVIVDDHWTRANNERLDKLARMLQSLRQNNAEPDIVLVQEAWLTKNPLFDDDGAKSLPAKTGYPYHAWGSSPNVDNHLRDYWDLLRGQGERGFVGAGLLILSKHPIRKVARVEYGSDCKGTDCLANKGAVYAKIEHAGLNETIDVITTHLQAHKEHERVRAAQVKQLVAFARENSSSRIGIIAGDFNFRTPDKESGMQNLEKSQKVLDAGEECVAKGSDCDVTARTSRRQLGGEILDHIYFSRTNGVSVTPIRGDIPEWTFEQKPLSDHPPVVIDFELKAN